MAPRANIILVEADDRLAKRHFSIAAQTAAALPGVSVVSMSWGDGEFSGETSLDSHVRRAGRHVPGVDGR